MFMSCFITCYVLFWHRGYVFVWRPLSREQTDPPSTTPCPHCKLTDTSLPRHPSQVTPLTSSSSSLCSVKLMLSATSSFASQWRPVWASSVPRSAQPSIPAVIQKSEVEMEAIEWRRGGATKSGYMKRDSSPALCILLLQDIDIWTGTCDKPRHSRPHFHGSCERAEPPVYCSIWERSQWRPKERAKSFQEENTPVTDSESTPGQAEGKRSEMKEEGSYF